MKNIDRILIGALVLGVWSLVAMQFFGGMTTSAAAPQRGESIISPAYVKVTNWPSIQEVEGSVYCWNCE